MGNVTLKLESGDPMSVRHFRVAQSLSAVFRVDLVARVADDAVALRTIVGRPASFHLASDHGSRDWTGVIAEAAQTQVEPSGLSTYTLQLVPTMWLLTQRRNHRLLQHLSVPEMVETVLGEWGIAPIKRLTGAYPKLPMRTQYAESDYDFVRRLLAEAGISFFFHTEEGAPTQLVLTDAPHLAPPRAEGPVPFHDDTSNAQGAPYVTGVDIRAKVTPAHTTVRDYDFRRPRYGLGGAVLANEAPHPLLEDYHFAPGRALGEGPGGQEPFADREGAYRHQDVAAASAAKLRAEAHDARRAKITFYTSLADLEPGTVFDMTGHPHPTVAPGKGLLVTRSWIDGDVEGEWHTGGEAVPADKPYRPPVNERPELGKEGAVDDPFKPLSRLAKPRVQGWHSAVVTGPAGEEIHTDEHGRVKLQFPWDREGKFDDQSSPWIRVSQAWAGTGFGNVSIPRVGQEVLVHYQDGDPDHPVVVGRMHNTLTPTPYTLPENKTRTSFKSRSAAGANEVTMEDRAGGEMLYLQAQKDLHKIVKNDELEHTQGSRHLQIEGDLIVHAKGKIIFNAGDDLVFEGGPLLKINPGDEPPAPEKPKPLTSAAPKPAAPAAPAAPGKPKRPSHPWMDKLATSRLDNGEDHSCVATSLGNMDRLGIPSFQGGTTGDPNNPRGAMVQMIKNGHWTSYPLEGSRVETIRSPYGTVQANVLDADAYERMAKAGQIPSGSVLFQTRHGWDYSGGSRGNDMGIVRDGGRVTHNYADMSPIIYGDAKDVVLLVPKGSF